MFRKIALSALALTILGGSAFAANEYWVVKDQDTSKCEVIGYAPSLNTMTKIGNVHKTEAEAQAAMKVAAECK